MAKAPVEACYKVDNTELGAHTKGLSYRFSKDLQDKKRGRLAATDLALWGSILHGIDSHDGWVQVGERYLPVFLNGVRVVVEERNEHTLDEAPTSRLIEKMEDPNDLSTVVVEEKIEHVLDEGPTSHCIEKMEEPVISLSTFGPNGKHDEFVHRDEMFSYVFVESRARSFYTDAKHIVCKHAVKTIAGSVVGGATMGGAGGGTLGAVGGGFVGGAIGLVGAPFTLGLSIPVGAVIGGGIGLGTGAVAGGSTGLAVGGMVGYRVWKSSHGHVCQGTTGSNTDDV